MFVANDSGRGWSERSGLEQTTQKAGRLYHGLLRVY